MEWVNTTDTAYMSSICEVLTPRYGLSCEAFLVLHATLWFKGIVWGLKPAIDTYLWNRIVYCDSLTHLAEKNIPIGSLHLPPAVYTYDKESSNEAIAAKTKEMFTSAWTSIGAALGIETVSEPTQSAAAAHRNDAL